MAILGIIGGSGFYDFLPTGAQTVEQTTPFGAVKLLKGEISSHTIYFMNRHGVGHALPPHLINHKANIFGLWQLGVEGIISTTAVGALTKYEPSDIVLLEDFVDFISPAQTYFDGKFAVTMRNRLEKRGVIHTDFTQAYCPKLRRFLQESGKRAGIAVKTGGVYIMNMGPRFETPAEISIYSKLGWGNLVGMTNPPEAILARELEMHYAAISLVTNYAAGISKTKITHVEVLELFEKKKPVLQALIRGLIEMYSAKDLCNCTKYPATG